MNHVKTNSRRFLQIGAVVTVALSTLCANAALSQSGYRSRPKDVTATDLNCQIELLPTGAEWVTHLKEDLLTYWTSPSAIGTPPGNFPSFRANDGTSIDPKNPPPEFTSIDDKEKWLKGAVGRQYSRMIGRQIFAYCVAFNMTGEEQYLSLAKEGMDYLTKNMLDGDGIFYTWRIDGKGYPERVQQRVSQDMTYALMGPAMYYYLTRDPASLKLLEHNEQYIMKNYKFPSQNQLRWVREEYVDPGTGDTNTPDQQELVAQLDQINAYMLLTTGLLTGKEREAWLKDMVGLARVMRDKYFSEKVNLFWGRIDKPEYMTLGQPHVDFGHTIKTLWMMYLMGEEFGKTDLSSFATGHMPRVINEAFYPPMGVWIEKKLDGGKLGTDRVWWDHAELDQATATLALVHPETYVRYLVPNYQYWFQYFVDHEHGGIWHQLTGEMPGKPEYLKAHLWKNSFHEMEHALVGYITSEALRQHPVDLYFALPQPPAKESIHPYLFLGKVDGTPVESSLNEFPNLKKYKVSFVKVKP